MFDGFAKFNISILCNMESAPPKVIILLSNKTIEPIPWTSFGVAVILDHILFDMLYTFILKNKIPSRVSQYLFSMHEFKMKMQVTVRSKIIDANIQKMAIAGNSAFRNSQNVPWQHHDQLSSRCTTHGCPI